MVRPALIVAFALMAAHDPSCGGDAPGGGVNAPCTRPADCADGLACTGGVCATTDAGAPSESGSDAHADTRDE